MYTAILIFHVIVCIFLVLTVLIQQGKGAEMGAVFGSSEAIFGSSGPVSLLGKITTGLAIVFMLTSLGLTYLSANKRPDTIMEGIKPVAPKTEKAPLKTGAESIPSKIQDQAEKPPLPEKNKQDK